MTVSFDCKVSNYCDFFNFVRTSGSVLLIKQEATQKKKLENFVVDVGWGMRDNNMIYLQCKLNDLFLSGS